MTRLGIAGAGAWGTALANVAASAGLAVRLWARDPAQAAELAETRLNPRALSGIPLHSGIQPTAELGDLAESEAVLLVTPAQSTRAMAIALAGVMRPGAPLILCAKGLERGTRLPLSDVAADVRPGEPVAVLSGPSFAADVAGGLPTAVTLACTSPGIAEHWAGALSGPAFRVYHGDDVRGVEFGGAAKNVLAIGCGAVIGRGLGESARAALVARGFAEILRLAVACGGRRETLMGLSGLGDLVLTCTSPQSRNFAFGERLGRGVPVEEAAAGRLTEGATTAAVLVELARERNVEMPVAAAVDAVIAGRLGLDEAIDRLMQRPLKREY
ncbi:NAD(P)H-dependent glycerol-3-phosphate dehydrogenase [Microvirga massiliensis]|uniref:NAD(P)H-dependent glycerol-3-phosphate dehydrogenase n=1 Tax=Microvirga massiliensis TaxID=1033741 RepID=UPI00062BB542|nr:NAD(P)H-dependent glycerol-3-phosphate dehydrogenase [Microvirga massiliensis]